MERGGLIGFEVDGRGNVEDLPRCLTGHELAQEAGYLALDRGRDSEERGDATEE